MGLHPLPVMFHEAVALEPAVRYIGIELPGTTSASGHVPRGSGY
jgi:hypothetical protein